MKIITSYENKKALTPFYLKKYFSCDDLYSTFYLTVKDSS